MNLPICVVYSLLSGRSQYLRSSLSVGALSSLLLPVLFSVLLLLWVVVSGVIRCWKSGSLLLLLVLVCVVGVCVEVCRCRDSEIFLLIRVRDRNSLSEQGNSI